MTMEKLLAVPFEEKYKETQKELAVAEAEIVELKEYLFKVATHLESIEYGVNCLNNARNYLNVFNNHIHNINNKLYNVQNAEKDAAAFGLLAYECNRNSSYSSQWENFSNGITMLQNCPMPYVTLGMAKEIRTKWVNDYLIKKSETSDGTIT